MFRTKCNNGDNCKYYQQGICKFSHNEEVKSYKNICVKENTEDELLLSEKSLSLLLDIKQKYMLYIRHADKEYRNGCNEEFSLDPDITEKGKVEALDKFKLLLDKYGPPEKIITSPYLRTRTTAEIARSVIFKHTNIYIEIEYDNQLSECLKNQINKDLNVCLRPETLIHNPIPAETLDKYNKRIYNHTKKSQFNTWYITHGFNIYTVALIKKYKIKYPSELCGIMIDSEGKITNI